MADGHHVHRFHIYRFRIRRPILTAFVLPTSRPPPSQFHTPTTAAYSLSSHSVPSYGAFLARLLL
ncbi:hypothetical protein B0T18DRAFT_415420 [Schizothecium vesticola]|uniref:Uncharacterized protein n=1 Tax=Schizothecium vesticola TaxID=314040 RepID=A0AA40EQD9_9PEZI|nr:hypothetical protein B0T18DRAFT_415420 [Schizothecium vesticola]